MAKAQKNTAAVVRELLEPTITALGCSVWDVEFVKEGSEWYLRITIDKPEGVDINDCERVHRAIDPMLDEADPIEQSYRLEVSSPGAERVCRTPEHLRACMGQKVCAKLFTALEGAKVWTGILSGYDADTDTVSLAVEGREAPLAIPFREISRMNTFYDFEDDFS